MVASKYYIHALDREGETWYVVKDRETGNAVSEKFRNKVQASAKVAKLLNEEILNPPQKEEKQEIVKPSETASKIALEDCDDVLIGAKRNGEQKWIVTVYGVKSDKIVSMEQHGTFETRMEAQDQVRILSVKNMPVFDFNR